MIDLQKSISIRRAFNQKEKLLQVFQGLDEKNNGRIDVNLFFLILEDSFTIFLSKEDRAKIASEWTTTKGVIYKEIINRLEINLSEMMKKDGLESLKLIWRVSQDLVKKKKTVNTTSFISSNISSIRRHPTVPVSLEIQKNQASHKTNNLFKKYLNSGRKLKINDQAIYIKKLDNAELSHSKDKLFKIKQIKDQSGLNTNSFKQLGRNEQLQKYWTNSPTANTKYSIEKTMIKNIKAKIFPLNNTDFPSKSPVTVPLSPKESEKKLRNPSFDLESEDTLQKPLQEMNQKEIKRNSDIQKPKKKIVFSKRKAQITTTDPFLSCKNSEDSIQPYPSDQFNDCKLASAYSSVLHRVSFPLSTTEAKNNLKFITPAFPAFRTPLSRPPFFIKKTSKFTNQALQKINAEKEKYSKNSSHENNDLLSNIEKLKRFEKELKKSNLELNERKVQMKKQDEYMQQLCKKIQKFE